MTVGELKRQTSNDNEPFNLGIKLMNGRIQYLIDELKEETK